MSVCQGLQALELTPHQVDFVTTPITTNAFKKRVFQLVSDHLAELRQHGENATSTDTLTRAEPILAPLTPEDTRLFPSAYLGNTTACISPWIDLTSTNPFIASISRQVLNMELNYANFCGLRYVMITGPAQDGSKAGGNLGLAQYSRAVEEALTIGSRISFLIHLPMYREPSEESPAETLSALAKIASKEADKEIDIFTTWDSWNHIRTVCSYNMRLHLGM